MFTPVSSQAQAFVPAHAAYPHLRNAPGGPPRPGGVTLYGAHGQPLPPQQQPAGAETTLPPPQGMYPYGGAPPPLASSMPDPVRPLIPPLISLDPILREGKNQGKKKYHTNV